MIMQYRVIALLTSLILLVGCNDFLEKKPDDRAIIDSPEKVGALLVYAYPSANHHAFCYAMSDNATLKPQSERKHETNKNAYYWEDFIRVDQDSPEYYWNRCYRAIMQANHALDKIEPLIIDGKVPADYAAYYGEALLCRAYAHFMLVNLWSPQYNPETAKNDLGIPYVKEPETVVMKNYERGTVESVYADIENDLTTGLKHLDDYAYESDQLRLHWNTQSANTFAARFYSMKGDFEKVLEYTGNAFTRHPDELLREINTVYAGMDINERIPLWGKTTEKCNFLVTPQYSNWFLYFYGSYEYGLDNEMYRTLFKGDYIDYVVPEPFVATKSAQGGYSDGWAFDIYGNDQNYFMAKWGFHTEKDGLNSETGYYMIMNVLFDAEEALFLRMEAQAMLGNYEMVRNGLDIYFAKRVDEYSADNHVTEEKLLNRYAEKVANYKLNPFYNIPDAARPYLNCLYDLRRKEFYYTGMRWFDIRRFRTPVVHKTGEKSEIVLATDDLRRQIQIPIGAIASGIEENPR
jgi:hypothetical protein